jgi:hypothetical protein
MTGMFGTPSKLGLLSSSLHDDLDRARRVKAKPLCGRFASPDTSATARGMAATRKTVAALVPEFLFQEPGGSEGRQV